MSDKVMSWKHKLSLNKRMALLSGVMLVPLTLLIVYLVITLVNFCNAYNQIVRNITDANAYNIEFKEKVDYTLYRVSIGSVTMDNLKEGKITEDEKSSGIANPYELIDETKTEFTGLIPKVSDPNNKRRIEDILRLLDNLERAIDTVDQNTRDAKNYQILNSEGEVESIYNKNAKMMDNDIRLLTEMIQEGIQEYIYYEAQSFEVIRKGLSKEEQQALLISLSALAGILLASLLISRAITQSVTEPIKELCKVTELVAKGDFTSHTEIQSGDEIQVLTNSFNDMTQEIGYLVENIKIEQQNLRATELKLLQAQINPHFLYNTLDAIVWLAEGKQTDQVVNMVTSLSQFFRTVLNEGEDYITIEDEKSHVESYLRIQQFRYQDILEYEIDIEKELYSHKILKLTLQPLVENALYHGIKQQREMGKIIVRGYAQGNEIILEVEDNGVGMSRKELEELRRKIKGEHSGNRRGFGLANVDERIRLNYGSEYGLIFESQAGVGTLVKVCLPK